MKRAHLLILLAAACRSPEPVDEGPARLTESALLEHISFLAADSLLGRLAGSNAETKAGDYIIGHYEDIQLSAPVEAYRQAFEFVPRTGGLDTSYNVIGILAGAGSLSDEWIIVGAHYDHIGVDTLDGVIAVNNGADDNASGTAMMMELAASLSGYYRQGSGTESDHRGLMFIAFGAEEAGLLGSRAFMADPPVAAENIFAMINLDMVGRLRGDSLFVIGASSSGEWFALLEVQAEESLMLIYDDQYVNRSDIGPFYSVGIPSVFFFTGLHPQYHSPDDDLALIDGPGMVETGNFVLDILEDLARRKVAL